MEQAHDHDTGRESDERLHRKEGRVPKHCPPRSVDELPMLLTHAISSHFTNHTIVGAGPRACPDDTPPILGLTNKGRHGGLPLRSLSLAHRDVIHLHAQPARIVTYPSVLRGPRWRFYMQQ